MYLGEHKNHAALWTPPTCSLNKRSQVFDVFTWIRAFSPQLLALVQLYKWQVGHLSNRATVRSFKILSSWGKLRMVRLNLVWNAAQMCCLRFFCAMVVVGRIPTLLFTELTVQDWYKHESSPNPAHVVSCWLYLSKLLQCCSWQNDILELALC